MNIFKSVLYFERFTDKGDAYQAKAFIYFMERLTQITDALYNALFDEIEQRKEGRNY
jgi:hypothetical protein